MDIDSDIDIRYGIRFANSVLSVPKHMPDPFGLYSEGRLGEWRGRWIGIDQWLFLVDPGHAVALHNWECYHGCCGHPNMPFETCFFQNGSYYIDGW